MMQTFAVTVPAGVGPGQQFQASLDGQLTMVIVPHGSGPSSTLHVQIPARGERTLHVQIPARRGVIVPHAFVQRYALTVPHGIQPGGRFLADLGGQHVWLTCPRNLGPGKQMLVDASTPSGNGGSAKSWPPPIGVPEDLNGTRPLSPLPPSPTVPRHRHHSPYPQPNPFAPLPVQIRTSRSTSCARSRAA